MSIHGGLYTFTSPQSKQNTKAIIWNKETNHINTKLILLWHFQGEDQNNNGKREKKIFLGKRKYYQPSHASEILSLSSSASGAEMDRNTHDHIITLLSSRQILVGNIFCFFYFVLLFSKDNEIFLPIAVCPDHNAFNSENIGQRPHILLRIIVISCIIILRSNILSGKLHAFNMRGFKRFTRRVINFWSALLALHYKAE